ncbi:type I secretion system permease/ATPase [Tatumella terrea]|uniref:type I secretion system permease/ATPase n=1 Tax=Tatumella terrea TaxID=419007 RepID=UPI0031D07833
MSHHILVDSESKVLAWVDTLSLIAKQYRLSFSHGAMQSQASWLAGKYLPEVLGHLARQAGLHYRILSEHNVDLSSRRLPLVAVFKNGDIGIIESFDGEKNVALRLIQDHGLSTSVPLEGLLDETECLVALRPSAPARDIRTENYLAAFRPDWLRKIALKDLRPYGYVMLASLAINVLSLSGILFSMQVYDRVIPAQSYPTLYVLFGGVLIASVFGFLLKVVRSHVMDILGKRADMRVSDRVFGHALRLRYSAIPRSTGSFIAQVRELEQLREMVTSTTVSAIVDLPFFILFFLVLTVVSPYLCWIAPVAAILMIIPGLLMQKKLARQARKNVHEATLRNAILVESLQGIQDIKLMQAESHFQQQWNSYIQVTAESGAQTRKITHGLLSWGTTLQNLVYALVVVIGAPLVISGDITTGAMVAASLLSSRMIAPMTALCGVLARWQQVKAAKAGLDNLMQLPVENNREEVKVHTPVLHGEYTFAQASFRYADQQGPAPLTVHNLHIKAGEKIALLGRNGAGKSTFLQALVGNVDLVSGELRADSLSLPHIDIADIRRNTGLLTQDARLFHGTLRENLVLGRSQATDSDIFEILEVCAAADFIKKLPLGLEHPIMEGGSGLSGGQRQAILLARTLLRDPNIVLLDEPTASLDEHTEKEFIERFTRWIGGRTLIIATHRAAVLSLVDRVLVLKDGQLTLDTPKAKLLNKDAREKQNDIQ